MNTRLLGPRTAAVIVVGGIALVLVSLGLGLGVPVQRVGFFVGGAVLGILIINRFSRR